MLSMIRKSYANIPFPRFPPLRHTRPAPRHELRMSYSSDPDDASGLSNFLDFRFLVRHVRLVKGSALVLLLLAGAGLAACDVMPGLRDDVPQPASDSLQISLLEPGHMVTGLTGSGPLRMQTVGPGEKKAGTASFDAKHACTMTLYRPDGPRGAGYYHRSAELSYPDSVLTQANGETTRLTARLRLQEVPHSSRINARLRCRLPAVDGAEQRVRRFFRFGSEQLAAAGFTDPDSTANQEYRRTGPQSRTGPTQKELDCDDVQVCWQGECVVFDNATTCGGGGASGGNNGWVGGLPPNQPCSGGDPCPMIYPDDMEGGPTGEPGPGVNENLLCVKDPLKDMDIRATCSGVEGGRFGENARGPGNPHYGIDLLAEIGTPTWAFMPGEVYLINTDPDASDFGKFVMVKSGDYIIIYAHLDNIDVKRGDKIVAGKTQIGKTGVTGNSCNNDCSCGPPHLHIGIKKGNSWNTGDPVDPEEGFIGTQFGDNGNATSDYCSS